jgi:hypothetical protein
MYPAEMIAVDIKVIGCGMNSSITPASVRPVAAGTISYIRNALGGVGRAR